LNKNKCIAPRLKIIALLGNLRAVFEQDYCALDLAALIEQTQPVACKVDLRWCNWQQYFNRQQQAMSLGGVLGKVHLRGDLSAFLQMLQAGQWLHISKETTFGMGQFILL